jgi:hypothetical protein
MRRLQDQGWFAVVVGTLLLAWIAYDIFKTPIDEWWARRGPHAWYLRVDRMVNDGGTSQGTEVDMLYSRQRYRDKALCEAAASRLWPSVPPDPDDGVLERGLFCALERTSSVTPDSGTYLDYVRESERRQQGSQNSRPSQLFSQCPSLFRIART